MFEQVRAVGVLHRAGMINLFRPDQVLASIRALRAYGPIAGAARIAARRDADAVAVIDELGELTYRQLDRRANALARAWTRQGFGADSVIAVLCRDHRWVIDTMLAAAKLGARLLLMNTGFGATQLADVAAREGVTALVHDAEFADLVPARLTGTDGADLVPAELTSLVADEQLEVPAGLASFVADEQLEVPAGLASFVADEQLEDLITHTGGADLPAPRRPGSLVLLTSGTTGTPKGAPRQVRSPLAAAQFLDR
ncbi:MAG TPA: AMP-binding protein, partial [Pseudonocardiaceae bacterium]